MKSKKNWKALKTISSYLRQCSPMVNSIRFDFHIYMYMCKATPSNLFFLYGYIRTLYRYPSFNVIVCCSVWSVATLDFVESGSR